MTIYAQEGWGKSDKMDRGMEAGAIAGVIWSPRDEDPGSLPRTILECRSAHPGAVMLFDPQFYATTVTNPRAGHLPDYPYYQHGLSRASFSDPQNIQKFVRETLEYQATLQVDRLVGPTVLLEDFRDPWSQVALMMASASVSYHASMRSPPPLLISLLISETALTSQPSLEEYLDHLSLLEAHGVYFIVRRNSQQYQAVFEPTSLENLLYLVYVLAEVNKYEVVSGFCDFVGLLLHAVGATATGSGWYSNLRQFSMDRFLPAEGGRAPRPRYSSLPLLNSILINELDSIHQIGQLPVVMSGSPYDSAFSGTTPPSSIPWPPDTSALHHWAVLQSSAAGVQGRTVAHRLNRCMQMLGQAEAIYNSLGQSGVTFDVGSDNRHLRQWRQALANFRARVGV